jgi:hypothetical protein
MIGVERESKRVEHDGYLGVHSEPWPRLAGLTGRSCLSGVDLEASSLQALLVLRQRPKLHGEIHDLNGQVSA